MSQVYLTAYQVFQIFCGHLGSRIRQDTDSKYNQCLFQIKTDHPAFQDIFFQRINLILSCIHEKFQPMEKVSCVLVVSVTFTIAPMVH